MLQKEFEERIGRSVSEQEFIEINAMYMMAGDDIDKDTFCREWLKIGNTALVRGLYDTAYHRNQELNEHKLLLKESQEIVSDAADAMLDIMQMLPDGGSSVAVAAELEKKAWWLVGKKEVVLRKLKKGIRLSEDDIEWISNQL